MFFSTVLKPRSSRPNFWSIGLLKGILFLLCIGDFAPSVLTLFFPNKQYERDRESSLSYYFIKINPKKLQTYLLNIFNLNCLLKNKLPSREGTSKYRQFFFAWTLICESFKYPVHQSLTWLFFTLMNEAYLGFSESEDSLPSLTRRGSQNF